MEFEKLENVKMSAMILKNKTDEDNKNDYEIKSTVNLLITDNLREKFDDNNIGTLLELMYSDLLEKSSNHDIDSIGVWLTYEGRLFENSIHVNALTDMGKYGADDVLPIYEFFKLTLENYDI